MTEQGLLIPKEEFVLWGEVVVEEKVERELVPRLKRAGASGIITYPLNKVIP